jgi:pimeloyl-ACP methyl ester carboxylesterase
MKTVLLIPGNKHTLENRPYSKLIIAIEIAGYKVRFMPIQWKHTTINEWLVQLENEYLKLDLPFNELVKNISSKTLIFAGDEEMKRYPMLSYRFEDAHSKIKNSKFIVADNAGHDVTNLNYIKAISANI